MKTALCLQSQCHVWHDVIWACWWCFCFVCCLQCSVSTLGLLRYCAALEFSSMNWSLQVRRGRKSWVSGGWWSMVKGSQSWLETDWMLTIGEKYWRELLLEVYVVLEGPNIGETGALNCKCLWKHVVWSAGFPEVFPNFKKGFIYLFFRKPSTRIFFWLVTINCKIVAFFVVCPWFFLYQTYISVMKKTKIHQNHQQFGQQFHQTAQQFPPNCSAVWSAVSPNCWAVWAKVQQFHQTAEQFGETAEDLAKLLSSLAKLPVWWNCWPNCWAVWGKLLSSLAKLLSSGQTAQQFGETADKTAEQFVGNCWAVWWNCWANCWPFCPKCWAIYLKLLNFFVFLHEFFIIISSCFPFGVEFPFWNHWCSESSVWFPDKTWHDLFVWNNTVDMHVEQHKWRNTRESSWKLFFNKLPNRPEKVFLNTVAWYVWK